MVDKEVLIPSLLVLLLSSIFGAVINTVLNAVSDRFLTYLRPIADKRQRLIHVFQVSHIVPVHAAPTAELAPLLSPKTFTNREFFVDVENYDSPRFNSPEMPPVVVASPVVEEALSMSMNEIRMQCQHCVLPSNVIYMVISTLKCLLMILVVQYYFVDPPGGWRRFCVCGAANLLSATCTPLWEYITYTVTSSDMDLARKARTLLPEEDSRDPLLIVEILVRISSLELTDLSTVLIQGSTVIIFAAVFFPLFCVFCVPALVVLYCWPLFALWGLYAVVWCMYFHRWRPFPKIRRPQRASTAVTLEFFKAVALKAFTLFVLQVTVEFSFLMGLCLLDGYAFPASYTFVSERMFAVRLLPAADVSLFDRVVLCSQLFF